MAAAPKVPSKLRGAEDGNAARRPLIDAPALDSPQTTVAVGPGPDRRRFSVYEPLAAFELIDELEFLARRTIEPIPFYAPQFLVPAMPRLDDRHLRLLVARDEGEGRSRLRLLMPFSVEATGPLGGPPCIRAWTHPFGPRGTLPLDHDDPRGTVRSFLAALRQPALDLPRVLVVPDLRLDGEVADVLRQEAQALHLPHRVVEARQRACLKAGGDPGTFLARSLSSRRRRELRRQRRILEQAGPVGFTVARSREDVREALEEFLTLEAGGWKGRERSALLTDRYRAAFAREAVDGLAACGRVRIHTLRVAGRPVASLVVLVCEGEAVLWKMAYDEAHARASPGFQLMAETSSALIADPAIRFVDSCAVPDHSLVNRIWRDRMEIGTLVIGLDPDAGRTVERASAALLRTSSLKRAVWRLRTALRRLRPGA